MAVHVHPTRYSMALFPPKLSSMIIQSPWRGRCASIAAATAPPQQQGWQQTDCVAQQPTQSCSSQPPISDTHPLSQIPVIKAHHSCSPSMRTAPHASGQRSQPPELGIQRSAWTSAPSPWWAWQDHAQQQVRPWQSMQGLSPCHRCRRLCGSPQSTRTWHCQCVRSCHSSIAEQSSPTMIGRRLTMMHSGSQKTTLLMHPCQPLGGPCCGDHDDAISMDNCVSWLS